MSLKKLVAAIIICQLAGIIGSVFTFDSIPTWYATLEKPFFTPPNWLFGPAWLTLYTLMGISLYLVWMKGFGKNKFALKIFTIQLVLNALWSIIFFGLHQIFFALVEIAVLWIAIALTIKSFYRMSKTAAWLLVPYLVWVSFAMILNFSIWQLNLI